MDQSERRDCSVIWTDCSSVIILLLSLSSPGASHLFLCGLRREDFVQFKGHDFALVGEVEDGVVLRVEAQHSFGVCGVLLLLTDRPDATEDADVTL